MAVDPRNIRTARNDLVLSFLSVRRAIGVLGFFLPLSMLAYGLTAPDGLLRSMSAAHYTPMRDILVGTLCAQAVFLWSYVGYLPKPGEWLSDRIVARVAAVNALVVALVPTSPDGAAPESAPPFDPALDCTFFQCQFGIAFSDRLHLVSAALYFIALALFCLVLFRRGAKDDPARRRESRTYLLCGALVVLPIVAIGVLFATGWAERLVVWRPVFWLEVVACFAFSTGWVVKGRALQALSAPSGSPQPSA